MSYLPKNYKSPVEKSDYCNGFDEGDNKFRLLSEPLIGWEYWTEDNNKRTPHRIEYAPDLVPEVPEEAVSDKYGNYMAFCWWVEVWNYKLNMIQILKIKQETVRGGIEAFLEDEAWGDPTNYDINIKRDNSGDRVKYQVIALPPKEITNEIATAHVAKPINLKALLTNENPFEVKGHKNLA
jgi:hypothetical protein